MNRNFTGYASAYTANQLQPILVRRRQKRTVTVDWNGVLDGQTIASVRWDCNNPGVTTMSGPTIDGSKTALSVDFNYWGLGWLRATMVDSAGSQYVYEFEASVRGAPLYRDDIVSPAQGPYSVTVTA